MKEAPKYTTLSVSRDSGNTGVIAEPMLVIYPDFQRSEQSVNGKAVDKQHPKAKRNLRRAVMGGLTALGLLAGVRDVMGFGVKADQVVNVHNSSFVFPPVENETTSFTQTDNMTNVAVSTDRPVSDRCYMYASGGQLRVVGVDVFTQKLLVRYDTQNPQDQTACPSGIVYEDSISNFVQGK